LAENERIRQFTSKDPPKLLNFSAEFRPFLLLSFTDAAPLDVRINCRALGAAENPSNPLVKFTAAYPPTAKLHHFSTEFRPLLLLSSADVSPLDVRMHFRALGAAEKRGKFGPSRLIFGRNERMRHIHRGGSASNETASFLHRISTFPSPLFHQPLLFM